MSLSLNKKNYRLAPGLARFNLMLFFGCLALIALLFLLVKGLLDPMGWPGSTFLPPHRRLHGYEGLVDELRDAPADSPHFEARLNQFFERVHLPSQFIYNDGKTVGDTLPEFIQIPGFVWEGREAHLGECLGFTNFFPIHHPVSGVLMVYHPPPRFFNYWNSMWLAGLFALVAAIPVIAGFTFRRARRYEEPLEELDAGLRRLGPDSLDHRLAGWQELAQVQWSFNDMAQRLESALSQLRLEKERAERAERSRREFLADVSHNLGTPLSAMQGWLGYLEDGMVTDPEQQRELFVKLSRELVHVSGTVHKLLELSRWENSEPRLLLSNFPLLDPLIEVAETLETVAGERGVTLRFDGLHRRMRLRADRSRVRELLQLFIENCIKHAGTGIEVTVRALQRDGRALISVSDNGSGISAQRLPYLKRSFVLANGKGTGLGLAIAEKLVQVHGGKLTIESRQGEGTTVTFDLELAEG